MVEIQRDDTATIAIGVGTGDDADVDNVFAVGIELGSVALVAAEAVAHGNIQVIAGAKFVETVIEFSGGGHLASAIERL